MKRLALCLSALSMAISGCSREPAPAPAHPGDSTSAAIGDPVAVGGGCEYKKFPGTCTLEAGSKVTFDGNIDGKSLKLEGNPLDPNNRAFPKPDVGASAPCTIDFAIAGTCTPCMLSVAECGPAAWEAFRNRSR